MGLVKTILRFADGRVMKGFTEGFDPRRASFRFQESNGTLADGWKEMQLEGLKAIFFVKDFAGNSLYDDLKNFDEKEKIQGRRMQVTFLDGEQILGFAICNDIRRPGFYLFPADLKSNNFGVFVISNAVHDIWYL